MQPKRVQRATTACLIRRRPSIIRQKYFHVLPISLLIVMVAFTACSSDESDAQQVTVPDASISVDSSDGNTAATSDGRTVVVTSETKQSGDCSHLPLDPATRKGMWTITQELYAADLEAFEDLEVVSIVCLGADCALVDVSTLSINHIRFVIDPDGQMITERLDSSEPDVAGRALDACFYDSGLEPSPDDAALIVAGLWSQFSGLHVDIPPAGVLGGVADGYRARIPIDLGNYSGPVIEEVDGQSRLRFLAIDTSQDRWFYDALLLPGEVLEATERVPIRNA